MQITSHNEECLQQAQRLAWDVSSSLFPMDIIVSAAGDNECPLMHDLMYEREDIISESWWLILDMCHHAHNLPNTNGENETMDKLTERIDTLLHTARIFREKIIALNKKSDTNKKPKAAEAL